MASSLVPHLGPNNWTISSEPEVVPIPCRPLRPLEKPKPCCLHFSKLLVGTSSLPLRLHHRIKPIPALDSQAEGVPHHQGMFTGLLGNLTLLSYFAKKRETEVVVVQTLGVISIYVVIAQLAMAEAMPIPHFTVTSIVVASGLLLNFMNYFGFLGAGIWRFWEDFITIAGLAVLPQARLGKLSEEGIKFVGSISGWTATLLFMWMPVSQMWTNFLNPDNIKGLSAVSMLLAMVGNGLMIPRALFIRDLMWPSVVDHSDGTRIMGQYLRGAGSTHTWALLPTLVLRWPLSDGSLLGGTVRSSDRATVGEGTLCLKEIPLGRDPFIAEVIWPRVHARTWLNELYDGLPASTCYLSRLTLGASSFMTWQVGPSHTTVVTQWLHGSATCTPAVPPLTQTKTPDSTPSWKLGSGLAGGRNIKSATTSPTPPNTTPETYAVMSLSKASNNTFPPPPNRAKVASEWYGQHDEHQLSVTDDSRINCRFTGSTWASVFYGWGNLIFMYWLNSISKEFFLAATAGLYIWIGTALWRDTKVYGYSSPLTSIKELVYGI
ncbi:similar to root cap 1 [Actinidia rufa]|uniref:Similar to root cap 1 n=1 Tax=Actinidia rufa TaxID=165716 RepID=A0A7J0E7A4_9ERIC|nr:similar to root cap 1 [Actinidia rufa]